MKDKFDEKMSELFKKEIHKPSSFDYNIKSFSYQSSKKKTFFEKISHSKNNNIIKMFSKVAAILVIGLISTTAWAITTGKININIGNTGHQKIDKNYNEVATAIDKSFDNEYLTITLESMAADPAYLIFEYDIKLKDKAIQEIGGEVPFTEHEGYNISLNSNTFINENEKILAGGRSLTPTEKITDKEFRLVEIFSIADIRGTELNIEKKIKSLIIYSNEPYRQIVLNADISQNLTVNVKFKNREPKISAEKELSNGSMLYIEEVSNSRFENFVLARIVSQTKKYNEFVSRENEFMLEDLQFAICNQNDERINYDFNRLDNYYEVLQSDGTYSVQENIDGEDQVRHQSVLLLKLAFEEENAPEVIKVLPVNRKLYNDRNKSEYEFYQNEDWYPVKVGENDISETSQIGGNITIIKIEETENELIFYYDGKGYVPCNIDFVLKVKNSKMNYWYPRYEEFKGIDGNENKIIYSKDLAFNAGMPLLNYNRLDNLNELEFAMFYNTKYDILSEPLSFNWEKAENNEVATIENIHFTEFVETINDNL